MRMTMVQAINDALRTAMREDPRVVVLGEDVGRNGGVFRATEGLVDEFGESRAIDTPLAESAIVGTAIGMAVYGLRPVPEVQFMGFLYPAFDQLASQAARIRFRSNGRYTCPLVLRTPYGGNVRSPELHSDTLEALCVHSAGLKVVTPADPYDAKGLLLAAIEDPDPVVFAEPLRLYRATREEVPEGHYTVPLGKAKVAREGSDVTVVAWGSLVPSALRAAEEAAAKGISCEVLDLRTLSPLDEDSIVASIEKTHRAVVCQEAPRTAGLAAEVAALVGERALLALEAPVVRVTGYDTPFPLPVVERSYVPSPARILAGVEQAVAF
jgi:pyruvate dehydrogenase E1 component beta subunit